MSAAYLSRILASFVKPRPKAYTPQFRVQRQPGGWRIFDRGQTIGFVIQRGGIRFDLWSFSPFEEPVMANVRPPGKVVDLHTLHNSDINLPLTSSKDLVAGVERPMEQLKCKWRRAAGTELELEIAGQFLEGQRIVYRFRVLFDKKWARYRFFIDIDAWKLSSEGFEPLNMMLAGALACRKEQRRWTHSIWEDRQGKLQRLVHSNALFTVTDFAHHLWRDRSAAAHGAWVAYATHRRFNPAMLIHQSTAPVHFATCSQLFDEHIIWQRSGMDHLEDGLFHFAMRAEFVNLGPRLAAQLLGAASDPPKPRQWRNKLVALPLQMDQVNSFATAVDPWQAEECPFFAVSPADSTAQIRWDRGAGHSDRHSIRLEGKHYHSWTSLSSAGAVCLVEPHSRYRLSAWIKTRKVERFARIELASYEYSNANVIDVAQSPKVAASRGWTKVEVELDSGDEAYVMPRLALYGLGTAWFDDVKLERIF